MTMNMILDTLIKLRKWKAVRKHSLHWKIAASVLLKLFISGNERCHTNDATYRLSRTLFLNVNNISLNSYTTYRGVIDHCLKKKEMFGWGPGSSRNLPFSNFILRFARFTEMTFGMTENTEIRVSAEKSHPCT